MKLINKGEKYLTQEQYDALEIKEIGIKYFIIDAKIVESDLSTELIDKINSGGGGGGGDLTNYYTKTEVNGLLSTNAISDREYVDSKISELIDTAPGTLNTLNELAAALGDDPNFATTIANQISLKANSSDVYTKLEIDADNEAIQTQFDNVETALNNKASITQLNSKQNTLVSGTNIKTINGESILGSGNIEISGGSGDLSNYYTKNETYNKTQVDALIDNVEVDLTDYYTKTEVDNKINEFNPSTGRIVEYILLPSGWVNNQYTINDSFLSGDYFLQVYGKTVTDTNLLIENLNDIYPILNEGNFILNAKATPSENITIVYVTNKFGV